MIGGRAAVLWAFVVAIPRYRAAKETTNSLSSADGSKYMGLTIHQVNQLISENDCTEICSGD
ncbi:hypothetical protein HDF11_001324 [Tunturiibacter psychrotolerans]